MIYRILCIPEEKEVFKTRGRKMTIADHAAGGDGCSREGQALLKPSGVQRHKELLTFPTRPQAGGALRSPPRERSAEDPSPRDLPRQRRRNPQLGTGLSWRVLAPGAHLHPCAFPSSASGNSGLRALHTGRAREDVPLVRFFRGKGSCSVK